jgi:hypothetical protein
MITNWLHRYQNNWYAKVSRSLTSDEGEPFLDNYRMGIMMNSRRSDTLTLQSLVVCTSRICSRISCNKAQSGKWDEQNHELPSFFVFLDVGASLDIKEDEKLHAPMILSEARRRPCCLFNMGDSSKLWSEMADMINFEFAGYYLSIER